MGRTASRWPGKCITSLPVAGSQMRMTSLSAPLTVSTNGTAGPYVVETPKIHVDDTGDRPRAAGLLAVKTQEFRAWGLAAVKQMLT